MTGLCSYRWLRPPYVTFFKVIAAASIANVHCRRRYLLVAFRKTLSKHLSVNVKQQLLDDS